MIPGKETAESLAYAHRLGHQIRERVGRLEETGNAQTEVSKDMYTITYTARNVGNTTEVRKAVTFDEGFKTYERVLQKVTATIEGGGVIFSGDVDAFGPTNFSRGNPGTKIEGTQSSIASLMDTMLIVFDEDRLTLDGDILEESAPILALPALTPTPELPAAVSSQRAA